MLKTLPANHPQAADYELIRAWHKSSAEFYTNSNGTLMVEFINCGRIVHRPVTVHAAFIRRYQASNGLGW